MRERPFVSVVIPTYNEVETLRQSLPTVLNQRYTPFEVILVDDGSRDETQSYAQQIAVDSPVPLRILTQPNAGAAAARNLGWQAAQGEIVAFIDTGLHAEPDWLTQLLDDMGNADAIGGKIKLGPPRSSLARYMHAARVARHRIVKGKVDYLLTGNLAVQRSALARVEGFKWCPPKGMGGEDVDLSYRLANAGARLTVTERAVVYHHDLPTKLSEVLKRYYRRGYANVYYSRSWTRMGFKRAPLREIVRHLGAVVLSPILALRYAQRTQLRDAPLYLIFIVAEHSTFVLGMLRALQRNDRLP